MFTTAGQNHEIQETLHLSFRSLDLSNVLAASKNVPIIQELTQIGIGILKVGELNIANRNNEY